MKYTCPCCGYLVFGEPPGSYNVCPICFWEDDPVQMLDPWFRGGANRPSLADAQRAYRELGAIELRFASNVRKPTHEDRRDPAWRSVTEADRERVRTPASLSDVEWKDLAIWYYWLSDGSERGHPDPTA